MQANHTMSHGGTDEVELKLFLEAVRNKTPTPLDVYDSVTMCVILPLSEQSIAHGSKVVKCPDFAAGNGKAKSRFLACWPKPARQAPSPTGALHWRTRPVWRFTCSRNRRFPVGALLGQRGLASLHCLPTHHLKPLRSLVVAAPVH